MKKKLFSIFALMLLFTIGINAQIIISQYIETNSGSSPKGIELWNTSGSTIDFSSTNLVVTTSNGNSKTVDAGTLIDGAVLVIGTDGDLRTETEANGASFVAYSFTYNGDDNVQVTLGGVLVDKFGDDVDPGSAWTGNGVSTANQNIQLKTGITTGDVDGWTDPSERFELVSVDPVNDMSGFGIAPAVTINSGGATCAEAVAITEGTHHAIHTATDGYDQWYVFTATVNGTITVENCTSGYVGDTYLQIIENDCGGANWDEVDDVCLTLETLTFDVTAGEVYYIGWADFNTGTPGEYDWTLTEVETTYDVTSYVDETGVTQPTGTAIPSTNWDATTPIATPVFQFNVVDAGSGDGLPTEVTEITIKAGTNNTADWLEDIGGGYLYKESTGNPLTITTDPTVGADFVTFYIDDTELDIADGGSELVTLYVWPDLTTTDNAIIECMIDADAHGFVADAAGSTFTPTFTIDVTGNQFDIAVVATDLSFITQPSNTVVNTTMSDVVVAATDINENIDTDQESNTTLTFNGTGTMSGTNVVYSTDGVATYNDLTFDTEESGVTITASVGSIMIESETFDIIAPPSYDLLISEVTDPTNYEGRFVEIYNPTGSAVDFDTYTWYLAKQSNGGSWTDVELTGTIAAGGTYVVGTSNFNATYGFAPDLESGIPNGNGDDGYFLYADGDQATGTLIDAYGVIDVDGTDELWEYEDAIAVRNADITNPRIDWTDSEWTITAGNIDIATPGVHPNPISSEPVISDIIQTPSVPTSSETVSVSATITDDGTITNAELHWGTVMGTYTQTISMTNGGSGDTYTTTTDIPALEDGTTVYYEIFAIDNETYSTTTEEYDYTVTDPQLTPVTFYFKAPSWMDNDPNDPQAWGPFESDAWTSATLVYDAQSEWWSGTVNVAPAKTDLTYQIRFCQGGVTKYQKATGDFGSNPTFTTNTGDVWIDGSDNGSYSWQGDNFYLSSDKISETMPVIPTKLAFQTEPSNVVVNATMDAFEVVATDEAGNVDATYTGTVTLAFYGNGNMSGTWTQTAVAGVATFDDLTFDTEGTSYTITASATGLTYTTSATFDVTAVPPAPEVFISEIAGDGHNQNYHNEYLELTNSGSSTLSLDGWSLEYYEDDSGISIEETINFTSSHSIAPNSAFVIAVRTSYTNEITPDFVSSGFSINNSCYVVLKDASDAIVDQAGSDTDLFNAKDKNYEFINCGGDNLTVANWDDLGETNGTPGVVNCGSSSPVITNVSNTPAIPTSSETVSVSATITDDGTVTSAELHWGTVSGTYTATIAMTGSVDTYTTTTDIPALANGTTVYYEIFAIDNETYSTTTDEFSYTVTDPVIPTHLGVSDVTPASPYVNTDFAITIQAQDSEGVAGNVAVDTEVEISLSGTYTGTLSGTYTGTISAGDNTVTLSGLSYDVAEDITLNISEVTKSLIGGTYTITIQEIPDVPNVFISEYIEGSGNNKAIEIYNGTGSDIDLSEYSVNKAGNGGGWDATPVDLTGTLSAGDVYVIANSSADATILAEADITSTLTYYNGDDAIGLFFNGNLIDVIGTPDVDPGAGWEVAGIADATAEHTLVRKYPDVTFGNTDWTASAGTNADDSEWIVSTQDDFSYIGWHGEISTDPTLEITQPVDGSITYTTTVEVVCDVENFVVAAASAGDGYISIDLNGAVSSQYTTTFTLTDLALGTYTLTATLVDNSGNSLDPVVTYTTTFTVAEMPDVPNVFISEYLEGSGNNKAIEIYNGTGSDIDLSNFYVNKAGNGGGWGDEPQVLSGTLAAGDVFVIANASADAIVLAQADITSTVTYFNGDDAIGLFFNNMLIDVIGVPDVDPGAAWDVAGTTEATAEHTLVRKYPDVTIGNTDWTASAGTNADDSEWVVNNQDDFSFIGWHGVPSIDPTLVITQPEDGSSIYTNEVEVICNVQNFEVANGTGDGHISIDLNGSISDQYTTTFTITDLTVGTYTLTATLVDNIGNPLSPNVSHTVTFNYSEVTEVTIHEIQFTEDASGDSPYMDQVVTTTGIVTAVKENESGIIENFYIQDGDGAWNGVFVYQNELDVVVGDEVELTGLVVEYYNLTEIKNITAFNVISQENVLPTPTVVSTLDANQEMYEGVLIKVENASCTNVDAGNGMWEINDDSGALLVDDDLYAYTPDAAEMYNVTGLGHYSYSEYKIIPRDENDIEVVNSIDDVNSFVNVYPNPTASYVIFDGEVESVKLYNVLGAVMNTELHNNQMDVSSLANGVYIAQITLSDGSIVTKQIIKK